MDTLKFATAISMISAVVGLSTGWIFPENSVCRTPEGNGGVCLPLQFCKPLTNLLERSRSRNGKENGLRKFNVGLLKKYVCGSERTMVCCPKINIKPDDSESLQDPINLLPLDSCGKFDSTNRISNGAVTDLFDFPWMAQLGYETNNGLVYRCGGTLINDKYVLTAAHCIKPRIPSDIPKIVRLGEYNMSSPTDCNHFPGEDPICAEPPQDIEIETIFRHPDFEAENFSNDIALIRLKTEAIRTDRVRPICLPIQPSVRNAAQSSVIVTGWGLTEEGKSSDLLRKGKVSVVNRELCQGMFKTITMDDNQMCLADQSVRNKVSSRGIRNGNPVGTCSGDSGGPIQAIQPIGSEARYVQYGVVSSGVACNQNLGAGIHTRLDGYLDWITNNIKP